MAAEDHVDEATWFTPGVRGIGAASFLADLGHEIPTALLPALLTSTLGAPAAALGLIEGIADASAGAARLAGGAIADDPNRRRSTAVGGYAATAVLSSLIGVSTSVWQVGALRASAWTARGLRVPARNALLADLAPASAYGRAYGFERAMDNLGAIGGPLLALALLTTFSVRTTILISVVPGLLAAFAIIYAIRRTPHAEPRERAPLRLRVRPVLQGPLGRVFVGIAAFECGNVAATLLILRATDLLAQHHGRHRADELAVGLYVAYNAAAALASVPAGRLGDRRAMQPILRAGVACFAVAFAGFAFGGTLAVLAVWFIAAGVGIACVETAQHATVAALAPPEVRGSAFGLLAGVQSGGNLLASLIAGVLWTVVSPTAAFIYALACMLAALIVFAVARRSRDA